MPLGLSGLVQRQCIRHARGHLLRVWTVAHPGTAHTLLNVGRANMKAKFVIPLIAVVLCLAFLLENLKVQRVLFGLALILITSLLWRTAVRLRSGPVRPGGARRSSEREPADSLRDKSNATGG